MVEVPSSNLGSPTKQQSLRIAGAFLFGCGYFSENWPFDKLCPGQSLDAAAQRRRPQGHSTPKGVVINLGSPTKQQSLRIAGAFLLGCGYFSENWPFDKLADPAHALYNALYS